MGAMVSSLSFISGENDFITQAGLGQDHGVAWGLHINNKLQNVFLNTKSIGAKITSYF